MTLMDTNNTATDEKIQRDEKSFEDKAKSFPVAEPNKKGV